MRTEPRFPAVGAGAGHYESFYLKATRPGGGRAVWIRHTVHKRPGAEPGASIWLTVFDAATGIQAAKATLPATALSAPAGSYIQIGDPSAASGSAAAFAPGSAHGSIEAGGLDARWQLSFDSSAPAFHHLPYGFMYRAPLPRTKLLSPYPDARFSGWLELDGTREELTAWPGVVGHNWGAEHAERWIWIQANEIAGAEGAYLDVGLGRIKLGALTTPWIANGILRLEGRENRLGGLDRIRSTRVREQPTACDFELSGKEIRLRGRVSAPERSFVGWVYADPKGPEHNTVNCSIADLELEVERGGETPRRLESVGAAAYELGMRETDHGIAVQPFADG